MGIFSYFFGKRPLFVRDKRSGGWVVSYKEHKGVRGQGQTKSEALECLERDLREIHKVVPKKSEEAIFRKTQVA